MRTTCSVPSCKLDATNTWTTIPVCQHCRDIILHEQIDYYEGNIKEHERCRYIRIRHLTPLWPILKRELMENARS